MKKVLCWMLGISAVADLALGAWASVFWGSFAEIWFGQNTQIALNGDAKLMGLVLGLILIFFAVLQVLAIRWIRSENDVGYHIAMFFGGYLTVSAVAVFVIFHRSDFLMVDGIRGALLVVFGILGLNEPYTVSKLRLPKSVQAKLEKRDRGRGRTGRDSRSGRGRPTRDRDRDRGRRDGSRRRDRGRTEERPAVAKAKEPAIAQNQSTERSGSGSETNRDRETSRRPGGSEREPRGRSRRQDIDNRSRTPEELIQETTPSGDRAHEANGDRSLAVVVRGDFRGSDSLEPKEEASESNSRRGRGSRRRRPRGRTNGAGSEPTQDRDVTTEDLAETRDDREAEKTAPAESRPVADRSDSVVEDRSAESGPVRTRDEKTTETGPVRTRDDETADTGQSDVLDMVDVFDASSKTSGGTEPAFGRTRRPAGPRRR